MLTLYFAVYALTLGSISPPARAERPVPPHQGRFHLGGDLEIFHSSANFTSAGKSQTLLNKASFDHQELDTHGDYELSDQLRAFSHLIYGNTSASNGTATNTNAGLNSLNVGAQWWLFTPRFFIVPQGQLTYPFWRVNASSTNALIGEGAMAVEGGAYAIWRLSTRLQPFGYLGYVYRDVGRSSLLPYVLGLNWRPSRWWFEFTVRGYRSASHDSGADTPAQHDVFLTRTDGGSYRYDAQGPSLTEVAAEAGWRFSEGWHVYALGAMSVEGKSAADGWTARLGVTYTGRRLERMARAQEEPSAAPRFEPSNDKYDETLFHEAPTNMVPKVPKSDGPAPRARKKVRREKGVDQMLNDTERQLKGR